jgi:NACHT domain
MDDLQSKEELGMNLEMGMKIATPLINQTIQPIIDIWIKPKLEGWKEKKKIDQKLEESIYENFREYLKCAYLEFKTVNVIALGNEQIDIDDIYQPLTIETSNGEEFYIDSYKENIAKKYKRVLIKDYAGMGKSTLMKKMFISAILKNAGIPIFIELKKLDEKSIKELIFENLSLINKEIDRDFILNLINRGDFIFFLDGYDEIPFYKQQKATEELKKFINNAKENVFFMTSRPEKGLASFGNFKETSIRELELEESKSLLRKIDNLTKIRIQNELIEKINQTLEKEDNFKDLQNFLGVPLLNTLIYITFRHKRNLSTKKDEFYEKVFNALYEDHDLSKDYYKRIKHSNLSKSEFFKVLSYLGYLCLRENKIEFKESKLLDIIDKALLGIYGGDQEVKADDVLNDLLRNIPLFVKMGVYCKWTHKSFMEYFAGVYINNSKNKSTILKNIYESERVEKYLNFLDIFYDLDSQTFEVELLAPILKEYVHYYESNTNLSPFHKKIFFNNIFFFKKIKKEGIFELIKATEDEDEGNIFKKFNKSFKQECEKVGIENIHIFSSVLGGRKEYSIILSGAYLNYRFGMILDILSKKSKGFIEIIKQDRTPSKLSFEECILASELTINKLSDENLNSILGEHEETIGLNYEKSKEYLTKIEKIIELQSDEKSALVW